MCVIFSHRHKRNVLSFFLIVSFSFFTEPHTHTLFSVRILIFLGCIAIVPCVCWMCVCHFMYSFSIGRFEVSLHTSFNSHIQNDVSFLCWFFTCSHFGFSFLFFCCTINCDVRIRLIMHSFYMWLCSMTTYCDAMRCDLIPPTHCVRTITFEPLNAICKPFLCLFIAFLSADIPFLKTHHLNYQITRPKYFVLIEKWCDLKITLPLFIKRKE